MPYSSPRSPLRSPSSPSTSSSSSSSGIPDLADSFVFVGSSSDDEAETGSTSTITTDLLDAMSDTSSGPRSLAGSTQGDLSDAEDDLTFRPHHNPDDDDYLGESYIDAEASSILTHSDATLGAGDGVPMETPMPGRARASEFKFIFPNPEASFSSSGTITDGNTPEVSLANLRAFPIIPPMSPGPDDQTAPTPEPNPGPFATLGVQSRSRRDKSPARGIDEGWLKDARTWAPTSPHPIEMMMPAWEKGQYNLDTLSAGPGEEKVGDVKVPIPPVELEPTSMFFPGGERERQLKRALRAVVAASAGGNGGKWGLLAFASCALAILSAFGPGATYLARSDKSSPARNSTSNGTEPIVTARGCVSTDHIFASTDIPSSSTQPSTPRSLATQLIPDLQSIRDAISTFASGPKPIDELAAVASRKPCSRDHHNETALSVPVTTAGALSIFDDSTYTSWVKAMTKKVGRPGVPIPLESTSAPCNCTANPSTHLANRLDYLFRRARDYAMSTSSAFLQLYQPMMLHLDQELRELSHLAGYIADRGITRATMRHLRSARHGMRHVRQRLAEFSAGHRAIQVIQLHRMSEYASRAWTSLAQTVQKREEVVKKQIVKTAQDGLEKLGKQADEARAEGEKSLRKAKKGLNRLIETRARAKAAGDTSDAAGKKEAGSTLTEKGKERLKAREEAGRSGVKSTLTENGKEKLKVKKEKQHRFRQGFTKAGKRIREHGIRRSRAKRRGEVEGPEERDSANQGPAGGASTQAASVKTAQEGGRTRWRKVLDAAHHVSARSISLDMEIC